MLTEEQWMAEAERLTEAYVDARIDFTVVISARADKSVRCARADLLAHLRNRPSASPALVEAIYALHHAAYSHGLEAGKAGPHVDAANIASQAALNAALVAALGKAPEDGNGHRSEVA